MTGPKTNAPVLASRPNLPRIRSIRPEFWASEDVAALPWDVIYDGPMPRRVSSVAPMSSGCEYVYMLFDASDNLVYVGRSFRPADRFTKHRRKAWWSDVAAVVLVRVSEAPTWTRAPWSTVGPNMVRLEACAIEMLHPRANIAAPARVAA